MFTLRVQRRLPGFTATDLYSDATLWYSIRAPSACMHASVSAGVRAGGCAGARERACVRVIRCVQLKCRTRSHIHLFIYNV